jgi:hypothetical protein
MSLYDMYFSKKNKNYMFEALSKVIYEETDIQIKDSQKYMDLYRLHYPSIFEAMMTDEISVLNKEIINRIGNLILKDINGKPTVTSTIPTTETVKPVVNEKKRKSLSLYSSQRLKDSFNRYKFSLSVNFTEFQPMTITLLREQNSLFSNPNINILFNDTENLLFKLKDTIKLGPNEYYTYECVTEDKIQCNDSLKIQIRNYLMNDPLQESDLYQIKRIKTITYENKKCLCLQIENHDIIEGEELGLLGLLSDDKIETSLFVKKVFQNYLLTNKEEIDLTKEYSCLQMNKNITITILSDFK